MRNWNIKPSCLCRKHLIGEHGEIHKAVGNLKHSGKWTKNLTNKGFLEPQNFLKRHNLIAKEMIKRGYNHKSPLEIEGLKLEKGKVDKKKAINDLKNRCLECKKLIELKGVKNEI
ncbi:MAG: pyrimidine dimer DNA glycosylase/endonuclease V [Candidatus Thorarchaeota archaeon]